MTTIKGIFGPTPMQADADPDGWTVGFNGVTHIELREENLGTYMIKWYDVYQGEHQVASMNALHLAGVIYEH